MLGSLHNAMIEWNQPMDKILNAKTLTILKRNLIRLADTLAKLRNHFDQCTICNCHRPKYPQLCSHCHTKLPRFELQKVDGDLLNWPAIDHLFTKRHFDKLVAVTPHIWPIAEWLNQFKYQKRHDLVILLAFIMQEQWRNASAWCQNPDIVLSVPLHISKWQSRGYNQAHLIASLFSQQSSLTYDDSVIVKAVKQNSQVGKTGSQRRKSLNGSFNLTQPKLIEGKRILLIDDVLTTGATCNEICRLLKAAGAKEIIVMTLTLSLDIRQ